MIPAFPQAKVVPWIATRELFEFKQPFQKKSDHLFKRAGFPRPRGNTTSH